MKHWFAILAFGVSLLALPAGAQDKSNVAKAVPTVESADILDLNQNQAERTRDQPGNTAPTWRAITDGQKHYSSLPGPEAGVLIQRQARFPGQDRAVTAGEAWRQYRNGPLTQIGAWLLAIAVGACAAVYVIKGPIRVGRPRTGRLIERFTPIERIVHWTVAISFVIMAISGLIILFGKYVLLPVFGYTLYGWFAYALKNIHNFVGPIFAVSIVVFFVIYVKANLPEKADFQWLTRRGHVKWGRFSAAEKLWFWGGLTVLGLIVSVSGLALDMLLPGLEYTRRGMQLANIVHLLATTLMAAGAIGHIYLGTIGNEGAYEGMRTGYVDDAWAQAHHDGWYEQVQNGEIPRERSTQGTPLKAV
jgi:formate dehydrogenase subunit gamma